METYICQRGDPWGPNDLDRAMAEARKILPDDFRGIFRVDHWRREDIALALMDGVNIAILPDMIVTQVFHDPVDPITRRCANCDKEIGRPQSKGGRLRKIRALR